MTDYYVNTLTGSSGNDGLTPETAWDSVLTARTNIPVGIHTVYCSGGDDLLPKFSFNLGTMVADELTFVGDVVDANVGGHSGYRMVAADNGDWYIALSGEGKKVSFIGIAFGCTEAHAAGIASAQPFIYATSGSLNASFDRCHFWFSGTPAGGAYPYIMRCTVADNSPGYNLSITNSIFVWDLATTSNNSRAIALGTAATIGPLFISNCLFYQKRDGGTALSSMVGGGSGTHANTTVVNCMSWGSAGGYANVQTLTTNSPHQNQASTVPQTWFVDEASRNFNPVDEVIGPAQLYQVGTDTSPTTNITTDIRGAERQLPWDIGPWAYVAVTTSPYPGEHEVADPSQANDPNCIYFNQNVQIGDKFSYKTSTETNGWGVDIDGQGYPIIDSGGATGTDSFIFTISRDGGSTWEPDSTWTFTIGVPEGIVYTLIPNADGTQRTNYPAGDYAPPLYLPAPTNTRIDQITSDSMRLQWDYPSSGTDATGFEIQRWVTGVSTQWDAAGTVGPTVRQAAQGGLPETTLVRFRVRAFNG